eukprot:SAG22_NODE_954_length_6332_cov_4.111343_4_plen_318_part_00
MATAGSSYVSAAIGDPLNGGAVSGGALNGKRALVTGARKGIGRGVALALARAGCSAVCVVDLLDDELTDAVVAAIASGAGGCKGSKIIADCSDVKSFTAAIDGFAADDGIDILVNNAIIPHSPPASSQCSPLLETTEAVWDGLVNIGFKGYFFGCVAAAKHMAKQGRGGSLVCLSSVHAVNPVADWTIYGSCKAGLERMVKGLAADLAGTGVRANCVAPGAIANSFPTEAPTQLDGPVDPNWGLAADGSAVPTATDPSAAATAARGAAFAKAVPDGTMGMPSDIAGAVLYLCSDMSRYMTGQTLRVDGGMSAVAQLW